MTIRNILIITPPQYLHSQCFYETALSFRDAFRELGQSCDVSIADKPGRTMVFGAHLLPKFGGKIDGGDYVIFNTEQVVEGSPWMTLEYLEILKSYEVWDYSPANVAALAKLGVKARHCPIGYMPCMENIAYGRSSTVRGRDIVDWKDWVSVGAGGEIDCVFYGSMNERRRKILDALKEAGVNVAEFIGYGEFRDKLIARAKVVLNIPFYESDAFEIFRVAPLLANGVCVASVNSDGFDGQMRRDMPTGEFVELVKSFLADKAGRQKYAMTCYSLFKEKTQTEILRGLM